MTPNLIIITGLPGTGKTTLGNFLSEQFKLPFISKDAIKELLFDSLGWSDRTWAKKMGQSAYRIFDYVIEAELKVGCSLLLESNFKPEFDNLKFQDWQDRYKYNAIQILCYTDGKVLFDRFKKRALSGERHPGHDDAHNLDEFEQLLSSGKGEWLAIKGHKLEVDTTLFESIDYSAIAKEVKEFIK